ncbi:hypothetical protein QUA54_31505 [Microcoleus sp. MOSTC5]|uniref:hypothetical protein n=1 Tax=Microcoleus sp. MOSTC5 TaxID=3055378 RepID=UPI002FD33409
MKLETYRERLTEYGKLRSREYSQKAAELEAEFLSEQKIPDAQTATETVAKELPDMPYPHPSAEDCELLELIDRNSPNDRWWRCQCGEAIVDISAESGEVCMISV